MKKFAIALALVALSATGGAAFACNGSDCTSKHAKAAAACSMDAKEACMVDAQISIKGMECVDCATKVTKALKAVKGVNSAKVDYKTGLANVDYCSDKIKSTSVLLKAVHKAGFDGKMVIAKAPAKAEAKPAAATEEAKPAEAKPADATQTH